LKIIAMRDLEEPKTSNKAHKSEHKYAAHNTRTQYGEFTISVCWEWIVCESPLKLCRHAFYSASPGGGVCNVQ
jgi:hypothetical protein